MSDETASAGYLDDAGVYRRPRNTRPPLGIMPKALWVEDRAEDILEAMERYRRGKYIIPAEWAEELAEHLKAMERDR